MLWTHGVSSILALCLAQTQGPSNGPCGDSAGELGPPAHPPAAPSPGPPRPAHLGRWQTSAGGVGGDSWRTGVSLTNGEAYVEAVDLRIRGRGLDFVWARRYASRTGRDTEMGNGWTHSYNAFITVDGLGLWLHDGWGRRSRFHLQLDGTYTSPEWFLVGEKNGDESWTFQFPDTGTWTFHPLDGKAAEGKLASIRDRNGNSLTFEYDAAGRLDVVHDTLGRTISIAYGSNGRIASVVDFLGREVRYDYHTKNDADGGNGDLKSVTSPAVVGTPNGNDFPQGKTTVYTYSKGTGDERLDHNLLSITDPRGRTWLQNTYGDVGSGGGSRSSADRVIQQSIGGVSGDVQFHYAAEPGSHHRTIVNDDAGNVCEYEFDSRNRLVRKCEFTGRAKPGKPTTPWSNRPKNKLRPSDPDFYETTWAWNENGLVTEIVRGPGSGSQPAPAIVLEYIVLGPRLAQSNLVSFTRRGEDELGNPVLLTESYVHDPVFNLPIQISSAGGETTTLVRDSANGNVLAVQHPIPGIVENYEYNAFGQITAHVLPEDDTGHRQRNERTYYKSGPQTGYLATSTIDAAALALTTSFGYDAVGNLLSRTDPLGAETRYHVNALDQVVRIESPEVLLAGNPFRYEVDLFYDACDHHVRRDTLNVDENGVVPANTHWSVGANYDALGRIVEQFHEVDEARTAFVRYHHGSDWIRVLLPEASAGNDPFHTIHFEFDERGRVYRTVRAQGDPTDQSTAQFDYDTLGNTIRTVLGLESTPRTWTAEYDSFGRRVLSTDPMGNVQKFAYDDRGAVVGIVAEGERRDLPGSSANVELAEVRFVYDSMGRIVLREHAFDDERGTPIGDGWQTTALEYSPRGQVRAVVDDGGERWEREYDTAGRLHRMVDPVGDSVEYEYDGASNVLLLTESVGGWKASEVYETQFVYDALGRRAQVIDPVGNTTSFGYDSRNHAVKVIDAEGTLQRFVFNGLGLVDGWAMDMDANGLTDDTADVVCSKVTTLGGKVQSFTDDNGNTTSYTYCSRGNVLQVALPDGSLRSQAYNPFDEVVQTSDANGSLVNFSRDLLGRVEDTAIAPGAGVSSDTTFEKYEYDGLSRMIAAIDDDSEVTFQYGSLSGLLRETWNGATTETTFDALGRLVQLVEPSGRTVDYSYDAVGRRTKVIADGVQLLETQFAGCRPVHHTYGNGIEIDLVYDGVTNPRGDFGDRQVVAKTVRAGKGGAALDEHTFAWDRRQQRSRHQNLGFPTGSRTDDYGRDAMGRLVQWVKTEGGSPSQVDYSLDGAGNRLLVQGGSDPGSYFLDPAVPEPADFQRDQYTTTPFDHRLHDANGNLVVATANGGAARKFVRDYRGRVVEVEDAGTGQRHTYSYDALGRLVENVVDADTPIEVNLWSWSAAMSRPIGASSSGDLPIARTTNGTTRSFTYSAPGSLPFHQRDGSTGPDFYLSDAEGRQSVLFDDSGKVKERYQYDSFGTPRFFDGNGNALTASAYDNDLLAEGMSFLPELGMYQSDARLYDPRAGRFLGRRRGQPRSVGAGDRTFLGNDPVPASGPRNNLHQLGIAFHNHEPASGPAGPGSPFDWLVHVDREPTTSGSGRPCQWDHGFTLLDVEPGVARGASSSTGDDYSGIVFVGGWGMPRSEFGVEELTIVHEYIPPAFDHDAIDLNHFSWGSPPPPLPSFNLLTRTPPPLAEWSAFPGNHLKSKGSPDDGPRRTRVALARAPAGNGLFPSEDCILVCLDSCYDAGLGIACHAMCAGLCSFLTTSTDEYARPTAPFGGLTTTPRHSAGALLLPAVQKGGPSAVGLLLPAVQKAREAAARRRSPDHPVIRGVLFPPVARCTMRR